MMANLEAELQRLKMQRPPSPVAITEHTSFKCGPVYSVDDLNVYWDENIVDDNRDERYAYDTSNDFVEELHAPRVRDFRGNRAFDGWRGEKPQPILDNFCCRQETINEIVQRLLTHRFIQIRGTPASGKTTTLQLIHDALQNNHPDILVRRISWRELMRQDNNIRRSLTAELHVRDFDDLMTIDNRCILIDDAQESFGHDVFWNTLVGGVCDSRRGLYIAVVTGETEPATQIITTQARRAARVVGGADSAPDFILQRHQIDMQPRLGFTCTYVYAGLYFTQEETEELIKKRLQGSFWGSMDYSDELRSWVYTKSSGHVGDIISLVETFIQNQTSITKELKKWTKASNAKKAAVNKLKLDIPPPNPQDETYYRKQEFLARYLSSNSYEGVKNGYTELVSSLRSYGA